MSPDVSSYHYVETRPLKGIHGEEKHTITFCTYQ